MNKNDECGVLIGIAAVVIGLLAIPLLLASLLILMGLDIRGSVLISFALVWFAAFLWIFVRNS